MPQPAALRTSRYAGSWMTARNLLRGRSAAGCGTTASLWTRPVTAAAGGEVWKLEDSIYDFIDLCAGVLMRRAAVRRGKQLYYGLSPSVMEYMLRARVCPRWGGHTACDEIGLPVTATGGVVPCGATAWWLARNAGL